MWNVLLLKRNFNMFSTCCIQYWKGSLGLHVEKQWKGNNEPAPKPRQLKFALQSSVLWMEQNFIVFCEESNLNPQTGKHVPTGAKQKQGISSALTADEKGKKKISLWVVSSVRYFRMDHTSSLHCCTQAVLLADANAVYSEHSLCQGQEK